MAGVEDHHIRIVGAIAQAVAQWLKNISHPA
jgi:hypothetical protein